MVLASKPGEAPVKLVKRTADIKYFEIDLQPILSNKELAFGKPSFNNVDITIEDNRIISGKILKFKVSGGPLNVPHTDYSVVFTINTTFNNVITLPVSIRVYSN